MTGQCCDNPTLFSVAPFSFIPGAGWGTEEGLKRASWEGHKPRNAEDFSFP
jgi:hypothetical protein